MRCTRSKSECPFCKTFITQRDVHPGAAEAREVTGMYGSKLTRILEELRTIGEERAVVLRRGRIAEVALLLRPLGSGSPRALPRDLQLKCPTRGANS